MVFMGRNVGGRKLNIFGSGFRVGGRGLCPIVKTQMEEIVEEKLLGYAQKHHSTSGP